MAPKLADWSACSMFQASALNPSTSYTLHKFDHVPRMAQPHPLRTRVGLDQLPSSLETLRFFAITTTLGMTPHLARSMPSTRVHPVPTSGLIRESTLSASGTELQPCGLQAYLPTLPGTIPGSHSSPGPSVPARKSRHRTLSNRVNRASLAKMRTFRSSRLAAHLRPH